MPNPYDGPEYRRLLTAARRSLERTGGDLTGSVSVSYPDDAERKAIIGVTGQYRPEGSSRITVRLADLDAAVLEATGHGLPDLLAGLGAPLRNRPAERQRLAAESAAALRSAEKSPLHSLREWFREWVSVITWDGTMTRLVNVGEQRRVGQAVRVLEVLEARAGVPVQLAELAAEVTGDTKALNHGTTLSTLVMRALALRAGVHKPVTTEERRELWDSGGVVVDDLASRVLVLNLPSDGKGLGEWLTGAARLGMPFYVTLQQLVELQVIVRVIVGGQHNQDRAVESAVDVVGDHTLKDGALEDAIEPSLVLVEVIADHGVRLPSPPALQTALHIRCGLDRCQSRGVAAMGRY